MRFDAEIIDLTTVDFTPELLRCIPAEFVRKHRVLPVLERPGRLAIALADPSDLSVIDSLVHTLHREIEVCITDESQLDVFIQRFYGDDRTAA